MPKAEYFEVSFFGGVKKIIKSFFNVPRWMGYPHLAKTSRSVFSLIQKYFTPRQPQNSESFEEAMQRLNLTPTDLVERVKQFRRLIWVWFFLFILTVSYSIYLLSENALRGFFPGIGIATITLTQIFRYHFWIFQIEERRLGCTFRDWLFSQFLFKKKTQ